MFVYTHLIIIILDSETNSVILVCGYHKLPQTSLKMLFKVILIYYADQTIRFILAFKDNIHANSTSQIATLKLESISLFTLHQISLISSNKYDSGRIIVSFRRKLQRPFLAHLVLMINKRFMPREATQLRAQNEK